VGESDVAGVGALFCEGLANQTRKHGAKFKARAMRNMVSDVVPLPLGSLDGHQTLCLSASSRIVCPQTKCIQRHPRVLGIEFTPCLFNELLSAMMFTFSIEKQDRPS
jgi:hypothetical protein